MKNYKMIIYGIEAQEGIQYVAEYPALKGVSGTGIDPEHAMRDLEINSTVNLEALREANLPIPESDLLIQTKYSGKLSVTLIQTSTCSSCSCRRCGRCKYQSIYC